MACTQPSMSQHQTSPENLSALNRTPSHHGQSVSVVPWRDATVESLGFPVRSEYIEWFWLPVLGPSATWLLRRIDFGFDQFPEGYLLDARSTAQALGIAARDDAGTIFARALSRLQSFGIAHGGSGSFAVRRVLPPVAQRHLSRMPATVRDAHPQWVRNQSLVA
ncbi:MAG: hypothetical protein EBR06_04550 [Acidimicrobiia bacterium]|nr:hypothetical protein [Acidimicrobiia bacterium]NDG10474.1 hypothetical protein [Actinomycetota bacterium]